MTKEIIIGVSSYYVCRNPMRLTCIGLGSCMAIVLYDPKRNLGALARAMLPSYQEGIDKTNPAKYVNTSIYLMVDELCKLGSSWKNIMAKLVGGAQIFSFLGPNTFDVGRRNIESVKNTLKSEGIPIVAKDVGGKRGKTISFDIMTGCVHIRKSGENTPEI